MKKLFSMFILLTLFGTLSAEKVYRRDGSFFELKRNQAVNAQKLTAAALKAPENYSLKWNFGEKFVVISKNGAGSLPVYLSGANTIIADSKLFYGGKKDINYIAKKYNLKLVEILTGYNLYQFETTGDSVKIAASIVENGDGFAFPNIIRQMAYRANPVKFPINDKYFKSGYQWSLKNTGTAIDPYTKNLPTLENADIKFEQAIEFIYNSIEDGNLPDFEIAKIAIMDSGVDFAHPDLKNKLEDGYNMVHPGETGNPGVVVDDPMYGTGGYSHGTDCAGVSAAEGNDIGTAGVCPWCNIYPVTYMEGGSSSATDETEVLKVYQKYVDDPTIGAINCSFGPMAGMGDVPVTAAEIESHTNFMQNGRNGLGGAIIYASGNDGVDASYYQLLDKLFKFKRNNVDVEAKVVSVGGSTAWDTRVPYSNFSATLDIIAPTLSMNPILGISTAYLVGYGDLDDDYTNQFSGTSSAAPVVTGLFGVIFSINPALTLEEATTIIHESSDKINPETGFWDENGHSVKFGYGRVNVLKAARLAAGLEACAAVAEETDNNIDDNCDGFVDEGFVKDISKVSAKCTKNADCANADFPESDVECLTGDYKAYKFTAGYCTIKNSTYACPDGTGEYSSAQADSNCLLECNDKNPCPAGFVCNDPLLGKCFPKCESDDDCAAGSYCTVERECKANPSEPGGTCETDEDCKYDAMCITQIPDGFCVKMCSDDPACGDQGAQCVLVSFGGQGEYQICMPPCEEDADCRSFGGQMQMKCHGVYNGKENVCSMPCTTAADCYDETAECVDSQCVLIGSGNDDDTIVSDEDSLSGSDSEVGDESSFEDDPVPDENTKSKKDSGCSAIIL
ncbi:MAG TPA: S8 family serine peptidase [bacterium]|nr:S8 family serine peptidase [bacterium]HPS30245.1 S8 family serine peptidase [bacterium]